ncbi:MAG TPA: MlaD family protein [Chlamydiales bacterium]|nr:MlaD family protein [Chlamydiales bacterium]
MMSKTDYFKNVTIGAFVLASIIIIVSMILFLKPKIGNEKQELTIRFSNISGIGVGTRVTFAGRPVGEVKAIYIVNNARTDALDPMGRVYYYQLKMKIDSHIQIYSTDDISISTVGLMGEKTIGITPRTPPKGVVPHLITSEEILYANSIDPLEDAVTKFTQLSGKIEKLMVNVNDWVEENKEDLSSAVASASGALSQMHDTLTSFNNEKMVGKLSETIDYMKNNLELLQNTVREIQQNDTVAKVNKVLDGYGEAADSFNIEGKEILQNIRSITNDIVEGSGSIGRILSSDDFYMRLGSLMSKANTLMNDLNHYGLLYQYDKEWQKSRTKKANLLNALNTPKHFRSYFNTEMDTITTSLARLTVLLEKADNHEEKAQIMEGSNFKTEFMRLMNEVQSLHDSLRLYNESLVDSIDKPLPAD